MARGEQLEMDPVKQLPRKKKDKKEEEWLGRKGILLLLVVTTAVSLILYFKNRLSGFGGEFKLPKIGGEERITFEK